MKTKFKERPILFNSEMVLAILNGKKTQTRRLINPQPIEDKVWSGGFKIATKKITISTKTFNRFGGARDDDPTPCPFGKVGDRLWVRETFAIVPRTAYAQSENCQQIIKPNCNHDTAIFRAGWERSTGGIRWKPSIHMPRWASRITLEITAVRVERLNDISQNDAIAEGCELPNLPPEVSGVSADFIADQRTSFAILWNRINGAGAGCWSKNPWVWVVEFKRLT